MAKAGRLDVVRLSGEKRREMCEEAFFPLCPVCSVCRMLSGESRLQDLAVQSQFLQFVTALAYQNPPA
jgi:hypothetical protein